MTHAWRAALLTLVSGALLVACGPATPTADVTRLDVQVSVAPDGTLDVQESATVQVTRADQVYVREVTGPWWDGITFVAATLDGTNIAPDVAGGRSTVADGRSLQVRIAPAGPVPATHTVGLQYRVTGAVALEGVRGVLTLPILEAGRPAALGPTAITLQLPVGATPLDGSGMAEAGWLLTRRPRGLAASRDGVGGDETATLMARFDVESGRVPEPEWQRDREQADRFAPAFISGGLFMLVIGAGVLWILRFQYPPRARGTATRERADARHGLLVSGLASIALAGGTAIAVRWWLHHLGPWPMALPVSIAMVGLLFVAVHRRWI